MLRFAGLERFGMSVNFGPKVALAVILCCLPLVPLGAALMTIVAAYTAQLPRSADLAGTGAAGADAAAGLRRHSRPARPHLALMAVPSLSQHFLITSLLRAEPLPVAFVAMSVGGTLVLGALLIAAAGRLYRREALLG